MTPKPDQITVGFPPPPAADYSDEVSEEQFAWMKEELAEYQDCEGEVVSGEPW